MSANNQSSNSITIQPAIDLLNSEAYNFAIRYINDPKVRQDYIESTRKVSQEYLTKVDKNILSPQQAAAEVNEIRNSIMELTRLKTSDIGRATAVSMKGTGKTMTELCEYYAVKFYGKSFNSITVRQQDMVYREIVVSAGRTRPVVNAKMINLSRLGKGLLVLSFAISVYNIATADDKLKATGRESVITGGGFLGGMGGGALAGLACGPGAPVCVTIGVFVGGFIGAFGSESIYNSLF